MSPDRHALAGSEPEQAGGKHVRRTRSSRAGTDAGVRQRNLRGAAPAGRSAPRSRGGRRVVETAVIRSSKPAERSGGARSRSRPFGAQVRRPRRRRRVVRQAVQRGRRFDALAGPWVRRRVTRCFSSLGTRRGRFGTAVLVAVAEATGGRPDVRVMRLESVAGRPGGRPRQRLLEAVPDRIMSLVLAGLAQRQRVRIARAILSGANTHAALSKAVRLAPGPLYHHLRTLERAGLLAFVERNRYDLTPVGRDLLLAMTTVIGASAAVRRPSSARRA